MNGKRTFLAEQGLTALQVNWDAVTAIVLFLSTFALYARTTAPGVLDGDFGEFQTNVYLLGVSHTGYPLYFLLAKLWTLLMPVSSIAFRANVFSGLFGSLTLVLLYFTLRTLNLSLLVSLFTSILFGVSRVQWSQAVIPDVYTLNSFFIVLVLWLAILWRMGRVSLWWLALAYGFSLTHHRTMILLAPALAIFVLWAGGATSRMRFGIRGVRDVASGRKIFQPRELLKTIAALFLPLLLYAYIPLRGESFVGVGYHPSNNINIFALNAFYDLRFGPLGFLWERFTQVYLTLLIEQFTWIGFAFGLLGIVALALKRVPRNFLESVPPRQLLLLVGLAHLAGTAFAIVFWVLDSEIFFIPSYLTFLFFIAIGIACACDWAEGTLEWSSLQRTFRTTDGANLTFDASRRAVNALIALGMLALCGFLVWTNFSRNDQSNNDLADARWQDILAQPLEENATIIGPWEDLTPLEYYQYVEGKRTDLKRKKIVIHRDQLQFAAQEDIFKFVQRQRRRGSQAYFTMYPYDTETLQVVPPQFWSAAPVASLWREYSFDPNTLFTRDTVADFDAEVRLDRVALLRPTTQAGGIVILDMAWMPQELKRSAYPFSLRLTDVTGRVWGERFHEPNGGRILAETFPQGGLPRLAAFFVPPDAPPSAYALEFQLRDAANQILRTNGDEWFEITSLDVTAAEHNPPRQAFSILHELDAQVGNVHFLGYSVSNAEPRGGDILEFSSWWQNISRRDDALEIKLRDANGVETVLYQGALFPNTRGSFNPAQIVRARHDITIPPTASAGYARLLLSLNSQALPPIRIALSESLRKFRVPIIQRPQLTLVGDSLQLLGYNVDRTQFRAGENLPLTLYWSANQTPSASYKVFVHLIDANGVLQAQRDAIPKNDTLPTNRWFAGEYITDEYTLNLPSDLAAGEYRILVGMYDELSGVRVPLMDANGARIVNDAVMLGDTITVRE